MAIHSAIYQGTVTHDRSRPRPHHLSYDVFSLLLDIDELEQLDENHILFGYNRWAAMSFWNRDHGDGSGNPLRPWVEARLAQAGLNLEGGAIRILSYPRLFGYAFNPLTVYYCYDRSGALGGILYEVSNTFAERHTYVIPVEDAGNPVIRQSCAKEFYVSPFLSMDCTYHFRISKPAGSAKIAIRQEDENGPLFSAFFSGRRKSFTSTNLASALGRFPLMTLKVICGIHWEALCLWLKRIPVYRHKPAASKFGASIIHAATTNQDRAGKAA